MLGKASMSLDAKPGATDRPVKNHAEHRLRILYGIGNDRTDAHASAQQVCRFDAEMLQQAPALFDVVIPCDAFDTAAGLTGLPTIENNALILFRQMVKQPDTRIHAQRRPLIECRVESTGRVHQ
jgi:hypothetical protein